MQPYRIPLHPGHTLRCVDENTCPPRAPNVLVDRRASMLATAILAALFAGSVPAAFALGELQERGHVEIDPAVLERALATNPKTHAKIVTTAPPVQKQTQASMLQQAPPITAMTSILADGEIHDSMRLVQRARSLASAGLPITFAWIEVNRATRDRLRSGTSLPVVQPLRAFVGAPVTALELGQMRADSPLHDLGLQMGDAIVSINGYKPTDDVETIYDRTFASPSGHATLEVVRGPGRVVIDLWWSGQ
ncbi:hypothetical protein BH09MYX1_BH09MYX1_17820 [soil metagenome]